MFKTVPRLRKDLAIGWVYNLAKGRAREADGYSHRLQPGGKYTFFHRSFCDLVVWEALLAARPILGPLPAQARSQVLACIDQALENGRSLAFDGAPLTVFSYYPSRDHLVPPEHPAYKHFLSWDAGVPDNDSTCIVLGSLLRLLIDLGEPMDRLRRPSAIMKRHLDLLKTHIHREGKHGLGSLSYACGARPDDRGVLTWIFDEHNEIDPTSNVNVLNFLVLLLAAGYTGLAEDIAYLSARILGFLRAHVRDGSFFNPRLQQYYPPSSTLFFWHRFLRSLDSLDAADRSLLDPEGAIAEIDAHIRARAREMFAAGARDPNPSDAALASPLLARAKIKCAHPFAAWPDPETSLAHFSATHYEIFHLLYPVRVQCITESLPLAAYLFFLAE